MECLGIVLKKPLEFLTSRKRSLLVITLIAAIAYACASSSGSAAIFTQAAWCRCLCLVSVGCLAVLGEVWER